MNIIQTAIRRILIRNADRTISTSWQNAVYSLADYKPSLPSWSGLIKNVLLFSFVNFSLAVLFLAVGWSALSIVVFLFFLPGIYRLLTARYVYGLIQTPVMVPDRRFKSGFRIEGYQLTKDITKKYDLTPNQIKISTLEGILKLALACVLVFFIHKSVTSVSYRQNNLTSEKVVSLLNVGDTLIAKSEKIDVFVKVQATSYSTNHKGKKTILYTDTLYEIAFSDSLKVLGAFINIDSTQTIASNRGPYLSYQPFTKSDWIFTKHIDSLTTQVITRCDDLFYVKSSDVTVTASKLPVQN
jgi:hypothetical protein